MVDDGMDILTLDKKEDMNIFNDEISKLLKDDNILEVLVGKYLIYFYSTLSEDKVVVSDVKMVEISKHLPDLSNIEKVLKESFVIDEYKRRFNLDVEITDKVKRKIGW